MTMVKIGKPDQKYTTILPSFSTFNQAVKIISIYTANNVQLGNFNFTLLLADNSDPANIQATTVIKLLIVDVPVVQVALNPPVFAGTNIFSILNMN